MGSLSVLLMLAVTAVVVLGSIWLVIKLDLAARMDRLRFEREVRRGTARLLAEVDRFRRQ